MKRIIPFAIFILFISFSACVRESGGEQDGANVQIDDKLPSLSIKMADGRLITNNDINGKVSVVMLFTTTCEDCRNQFPAVEELYQKYKNDDRVILFGISRADGYASVNKYWTNNNLTFPYSPQDTRDVYSMFAATIVPRIYISDQSQTVKYIFLDRPTATINELNEAVETLLGE